MEYLTIKEADPKVKEHFADVAKRRYSYWHEDLQNNLSVLEESSEERCQRMSFAKRKYSHWFTEDGDSNKSSTSLTEEADQGSFLGASISLYDPWLRRANTLASISVFMLSFVISYMFFFTASEELYFLGLLSDLYYSYILFLHSKTGYMLNGVEEKNLLKIRKRFHKSTVFICDVVSFLPLGILGYLFPGGDQDFYAIGRQKVHLRIFFVMYYLGIREQEPGSSTLLYRSLRLFLISTLTIHFSACVWFAFACTRHDEAGFSLSLCYADSWIMFLPDDTLDKIVSVVGNGTIPADISYIHNTYITSLYWATATTTSTGYGDLNAKSTFEKMYSIFAMMLGMFVLYGMTMGGMTSMLTNIDSRRSSYFHTFQAFQDEVGRMGVSKKLRSVCIRYFNFVWKRWGGENVQAVGVLDILPQTLRARFAEATFLNLIGKADLLIGTEEAFLRNLAAQAQSVVYLKNEFVQRSGEIASNMCYVHHGVLEVLDEEEKTVVATMRAGEIFGQILLVYDLPRINSIRCKTNCEIFMLDKHDFRQTLSDYPQAALQFVDAVVRKCKGISNEWPLEPPSFEDFLNYIEKTSTMRFTMISTLGTENNEARISSMSSRRQTAVYSTDYMTVGLPRVPLNTKRAPSFPTSDKQGRLSSKDAVQGEVARIRQQPASALQGTRMITANANYQDLKDAVGQYVQQENQEEWTWKEHLMHKTLVNPKGYFYIVFQNYIFSASFVGALYSTFIVAFSTTPGEEKTYNGTDAQFLDLLDVAIRSTCNSTLSAMYKARCQSSMDFFQLASCIKNVSTFSSVVSGNPPFAFNVTVPASYDISWAAYNFNTRYGIGNIIFAYFILDVCFYLKIFVNLRVRIVTETDNLDSFKAIFKRYNKWYKLWFDIIAVFPFEILSPGLGCTRLSQYHAHAVLRLNRALAFFKNVPSSFVRWENSMNVKILQIRAMKLILYIYTITHIHACAFYWFTCAYVIQRPVDSDIYKCRFATWAWIYDLSFQTSPFYDYLVTMYWATTTMTSTGYGDISPTTTSGRVFALATMISGTLLYGWLVAVIAATLSNTAAAAASFRNSMVVTKHFLSVHDVPKPLIKRAVNIRHIEWNRFKGTAKPGQQPIGSQLPEHLHHLMLYESVGKLIEGMPFCTGIDLSFIAILCKYVQIYLYAEGDIIIYEGDLSRNLHIIKRGHCNIVTDDLTEVVDCLTIGDYFGEVETLFGGGSPSTVVADTACEVIILQRSDIDEVLESFPVVKEQMDRIENDDDYRQNVLDAIKLRNENSRVGVAMTDQHNILETRDGLKYYGMKCNSSPACYRVAKANFEVPQRKSILLKLISYLMLPITFDPASKVYIAYESLRAYLIIVTCALVPFQFSIKSTDTNWLFLQYSLDILSLFDQFVRAHVMYYNEKGILVTHSLSTAKHYLRTGFLFDLLSYLPIDLVAFYMLEHPLSVQQWRLIALLRLNRLLQFHKVFQYFAFWLSDIRTSRPWLKHIRTVLCALMLHHFIACVLFLIACKPSTSNNDELDNANPDMVRFDSGQAPFYCHKSSWIGRIAEADTFPALHLLDSEYDQYFLCFYWAAVTLVCTGYGDVYGNLPLEMFTSIIVQILGTIFYSAIIGDLSATIQTKDIRRGHYKGRLSDVKKFFQVYQVTQETQQQVLSYYHYLWERTQGVTPDYLMIGLPPSVRTSFCQCMYDPMLKEAFGGKDLEFDKETKGFFRLLSRHIRPHLFLQGSIVCRRKDVGQEMFFIQRGDIAIMEDDDETISKVLGPGEHFGEIALLFATPRARTVKALTNCDLNVLSKKDLDDILERFPRFYERMAHIAVDRQTHSELSTTFRRRLTNEDALRRGSRHYANGSRRERMDKRKCFRVIKRYSRFMVVWNHISVILAFISSSMVAYQLSFFNNHMPYYIIGYLIDVWFLADMFVSFHKSYLDQFSTSVEILSFVHLAYYRNPGRFFMNAIMNAPLEIAVHALPFTTHTKIIVMACLRLNRALRMIRLYRTFCSWENEITHNALFYRMYKYLVAFLFLTIAIGGGWYFLSCVFGVCSKDGWTNLPSTYYTEKKIYSVSPIPFVDSLYWAVATMTSTGYGDIKPETRTEMVYACFVTVLGKVIIGFQLGTVAATLANDESLRIWYEQRVMGVKRYMLDLNFDKNLFDHVVQYYDFMWMKNHGTNVMDLFPDLTFSLRADIYNQICRNMIDNVELFKGCPESFLRHLCMVMVPASFMPGDFICVQGDIRSEMHVIYSGVAEAIKIVDGSSTSLRMVMEGDSFLCESVLCKVRRPCSLRACTYVDVFSMSMEGLQSVLDFHPRASSIVFHNARLLFPDMHI